MIAERNKHCYTEKQISDPWPRLTLESLTEAIITCDLAGNIRYMNAMAKRLIALGQLPPPKRLLEELTHQENFLASLPCQTQDGKRIPDLFSSGESNLNYRFPWHRSNLPLEVLAALVRDRDERTIGIAFKLRHFNQTAEAMRSLYYQATHDELTGLLNRREFVKRLTRLITNRHGENEHAVLFMDLDKFKTVNDTFGHTAGDEALRQLAKLLRSKLRKRDTLARLGGDEFGLLLEHCPPVKALQTAELLVRTVGEFYFAWLESRFKFSISIGMTVVSERHYNVETLIAEADRACYRAKSSGGDQVFKFDQNER